LLGRGRPPHDRALPRAAGGARVTAIAATLFWLSAGLVVYTHLGYPLVLWVLARLHVGDRPQLERHPDRDAVPTVSLIVPAYDEEEVIAEKVANALALDYPRDRLQVIVASDGSTDATADRARAAGASLVLELPPGG